MNIYDSIAQAASDYPDRVALVTGQQLLSYRALELATAAVAQRFLAAGVQVGEVVLLRITDPTAGLLLTLALARIGAVSLATQMHDGLEEVIQRCHVTSAVIGQPSVQDSVPQGLRVFSEASLLAPVSATPTAFQSLSLPGSTPWRIALSSGTTGRSKAMAWTHGASLVYWQSTVEPFTPLVSFDRVLVFVDFGTAYAIHRVVRVLSRGAALVLPSNPTPMEFARCIDMYGVTQAITVSSMAIQLLAYVQALSGKSSLRFHGLTRFIVSGEPLGPALREALLSKICPNLVLSYGASECGPIATADKALYRAHPRAAGRLLPTTKVQVVDIQGNELSFGQVGVLRVQTPGMVTSYLGDHELTAKAFQDGWYMTGDTGSVDSQGVITLGARREEWLELGGQLVDPLALEEVIGQVEGVMEVVVFVALHARNPQNQVELHPMPVLTALFTALGSVDAELVRKHCVRHLPAHQVPHFLGQVNELPRTVHGKISRRDLGQRFRLEATTTAKIVDP